MTKYDYPELLKKGTTSGPVTKEMRSRCIQKVKNTNKRLGLPINDCLEFWPDYLPIVRKEMDDK